MPTEVVNHQDAVVGQHLYRCGAQARVIVVLEIHHGQRQFAADHHQWPLADDPSGVNTVFACGLDMHRRVVHGDEIAVNGDEAGDQDIVLMKSPHTLGQTGLSRAGRTVEEDRPAADEGRADLIQHRVLDHEVRKSLLDDCSIDGQVRTLFLDNRAISGQGNRHGSHMPSGLHQVVGGCPSLLGESDLVVTPVHALELEQGLLPKAGGNLLRDIGRDAQVPGHSGNCAGAIGEDPTGIQLFGQGLGNPKLGDLGWRTELCQSFRA